MSGPGPQTPRRQIDDGSPAAELLSRAERGSGPPPGARERVWRGLQAGRPARSGVAWWQIALPAAAAAVIAIALVRPWRGPAATQPSIQLVELAGTAHLKSREGVPSEAAVGATLHPGATLEARGGDATLSFGGARAALPDGARITLGPAGSPAALSLDQGAVAVKVRSGTLTVVAAGPYLVEGSAALFLLRADASATSVRVQEGSVTVRTPAGNVAVEAGGSWSSQGAAPAATAEDARLSARAAGISLPAIVAQAAPPPPPMTAPEVVPPAAAPAPVPAAPADPQGTIVFEKKPRRPRLIARAPVARESPAVDPAARPALLESDDALHARAVASQQRGELAEAAGLYAELAGRQGPRAGTALYELGRLRQRFLHEPAGALAALSEYERRYPEGPLALEAALTAIEARISLGGGEPARAAMDSFLNRFGDSERAAEVRWLRASLLVEQGECEGAAADLQLLSAAGPRAADAVFAAASCARSAGHLTEARTRLEEYLRRFPAGPRRAEVEAALAGEGAGK